MEVGMGDLGVEGKKLEPREAAKGDLAEEEKVVGDLAEEGRVAEVEKMQLLVVIEQLAVEIEHLVVERQQPLLEEAIELYLVVETAWELEKEQLQSGTSHLLSHLLLMLRQGVLALCCLHLLQNTFLIPLTVLVGVHRAFFVSLLHYPYKIFPTSQPSAGVLVQLDRVSVIKTTPK